MPRKINLIDCNNYYNNFIERCDIFCRLKWRIQRAKIYFNQLYAWSTNHKRESNEAS